MRSTSGWYQGGSSGRSARWSDSGYSLKLYTVGCICWKISCGNSGGDAVQASLAAGLWFQWSVLFTRVSPWGESWPEPGHCEDQSTWPDLLWPCSVRQRGGLRKDHSSVSTQGPTTQPGVRPTVAGLLPLPWAGRTD